MVAPAPLSSSVSLFLLGDWEGRPSLELSLPGISLMAGDLIAEMLAWSAMNIWCRIELRPAERSAAETESWDIWLKV